MNERKEENEQDEQDQKHEQEEKESVAFSSLVITWTGLNQEYNLHCIDVQNSYIFS